MIAAAQPDQLPVMWDGGLVYRVADSFTWKAITLSENEVDASYFTNFEYVDAKNMDFVANIENFRARQYLQNTKYPEPDTKSVIENYFKPAPPRLDIPHNIGVPVPADKVKDAVVKFVQTGLTAGPVVDEVGRDVVVEITFLQYLLVAG